MDSNLIESTLNSINQLVGRIQYLEQQNANLQAAYADLLRYNDYLLSLVGSSSNPNTVPTVSEDGERSNKRLREESSDELRVSEPEPSFIGNSDGSASGEETNRLSEEYPYEESDDFLRSLFEENPSEENPWENPWENPLGSLFGENSLRLGEEQLYLQPADE